MLNTQAEEAITFFEALIVAIHRASAYNKNDQTRPAVVLWTDKERQWEALIPRLRERLSLLTFDADHYASDERRGPAYWVRCMLAGTLEEDSLPSDKTPVLYLPGVSKGEMRAVEECPKPLQPLAELQYRGALWTQKNGRDWTIAAFLQSADGGLTIPVGADTATREAMQRALVKLADEPIAYLRQESPLRAAFFDSLLNPDEVRSLLLWLNDPEGYKKGCSAAEWGAFRNLCVSKYGFDPETDGHLVGAELLGENKGAWAIVWTRFVEAARAYPNLPDLLAQARPKQLSFLEPSPSWPQDNQVHEEQLRSALLSIGDAQPSETRETIARLEQQHGPRRQWVWASLGRSPLAMSLEHLAVLAVESEQALAGATTEQLAAAYVEWGWKVDAAALRALAEIRDTKDLLAVGVAVRAVYRPWLEGAANAFQAAVIKPGMTPDYPPGKPIDVESGTCLLFSDGLRFDIARQLTQALEWEGLSCEMTWQLAALPTVTTTAKPAVSPVANLLTGGASFDTVVQATGTRASADVLRKLLSGEGYQVLTLDELGDPTGRGWTELGDIDSYGHEHGWRVAYHAQDEVRSLVSRVAALIDHGWSQVTIVTDHGWLLLPGGFPKAELPEHLTEVRKGRCARLKDFADAHVPWLPWHWDPHVRIGLAPGIHCFEAGKEWEHGGLSVQECVVPEIKVSRQADLTGQLASIEHIAWKGLRCALQITGGGLGVTVDIRSKAADAGTSLAASTKAPGAEGHVSLVVPDDDAMGQAAVIVVVDQAGTVRAQAHTTIGGD